MHPVEHEYPSPRPKHTKKSLTSSRKNSNSLIMDLSSSADLNPMLQ